MSDILLCKSIKDLPAEDRSENTSFPTPHYGNWSYCSFYPMKTTIKRWAQFTPQGQLISCTISDSRMGSRHLLREHLYPNEEISWMEIKKDGAVEREIEITFDEIPYETQIVQGEEDEE